MKRSPNKHSYPWARAVLCVLLVLFSCNALAQDGEPERPLVASGISPRLEQDSADGRKLALEEALRSAVEQALGRLLPAERIVHFYPLLLDNILAEPAAYAQDYQIIREDIKFGVYRVTVQTTLNMEGLRRDLRRLGLFLTSRERPRVAILVAERFGPQDSWHCWWCSAPTEEHKFPFFTALKQVFLARGLVPLDPLLVRESIPEDQAFQAPLLDDVQGANLARALGAQIAVLGQASYKPAEGGASALTSGSLRAVQVEGSKLLTRVKSAVKAESNRDGLAPEDSFTALAERMAPRVVEEVLAPFTTASLPPRKITVQVLGVRTYGDLLQIKEYLQGPLGVKEIKEIRLQSGQGFFALDLSGDLDILRSSFSGHDFGTFTTSAELTGDNLLILTITSKR